MAVGLRTGNLEYWPGDRAFSGSPPVSSAPPCTGEMVGPLERNHLGRQSLPVRPIPDPRLRLGHPGTPGPNPRERHRPRSEPKRSIQEKAAYLSSQTHLVSLRSLLRDVMRRLEKASERPDELTGVPSGFSAMDDKTWGFQKQRLYLLAARRSQP